MNKTEIKQRLAELMASGVGRTEAFSHLRGQGVKDRPLAMLVASHAVPGAHERHKGKIRTLVGLAVLQAVIALVAGLAVASSMRAPWTWLLPLVVMTIPLLFAWGFHRDHAGTYNAYLFLSIVGLPKQFTGFMEAPVASTIGVGLNLALIAFVFFVRRQLFPDFLMLAPTKVKGNYVFTT